MASSPRPSATLPTMLGSASACAQRRGGTTARRSLPTTCIFSLDAFKQWHPQLATFYRRVVNAEQTGAREVTFTFDAPNDRELPLVLGQLTVLPRHWWTGHDAHGRRRNIGETTLEPPLGSGPYRIKSFEPGRSIIYERVANYWGRDLPVNVGSFNLDELRFDYFRDPTSNSKRSKPVTSTGAPRTPLRTGRPATTSRPSWTSRWCGRNSRSATWG